MPTGYTGKCKFRSYQFLDTLERGISIEEVDLENINQLFRQSRDTFSGEADDNPTQKGYRPNRLGI